MPTPAPIVFSPSQHWHGHDGNWSSFTVRVGTPEQNFRILPSAATGATMLPDYRGCQPSTGDPTDCGELRGVFESNEQTLGFQANSSQTWRAIEPGLSLFQTGLEGYLGYGANASFGHDNVGLMVQNSGGPTLTDQLVGSLKKMPFFVGFFGLNPNPTNFTNYDKPQRSYLVALKDERKIPSLSYAYSAGAYYRAPKAFGSLTLGGFDATRFDPSNITFPFDEDDERPTSLKLQRITADNTFNGSVGILQEETYVNLDFTLPYLWLPQETCDRIATYFRLTYDVTTDLYLVDDETHAELVAKRPVLSFEFGNAVKSAPRVGIDLPYAAFDLQAAWPMFNTTRSYFPIRRANTSSQYTLGRAFMQEAYVIVDYERRNFSLHQAAFPASNAQKVLAITSKDAESKTGSNVLSRSSIAGIVAGGAIFVASIMVTAVLLYRHWMHVRALEEPKLERSDGNRETEEMTELPTNEVKRSHLMSTEVLELHVSREEELDSKSRNELA